MTQSSPAVLRIQSHTDLLALVPYLLGFHPDNSLVSLGFNGPALRFTTRCDLPTSSEAAAFRHYLHDFSAPTAPHPFTSAWLIGYGPAAQVTAAIDTARAVFAENGLTVAGALRVTANRYFSYHCHDLTHCPAEGAVFDPPVSSPAVNAVVAGQVALPNRDTLAQQIAPVDGAGRRAMRDAIVRARRRLDALRRSTSGDLPAVTGSHSADIATGVVRTGTDAVDQALGQARTDAPITDDDVAWLTVLLTQPHVRDHALTRTSHEQSVPLWSDVTRRAEPDLVAAPACLLAFAAWRAGIAALPNLALDRVNQADPDLRTGAPARSAVHQRNRAQRHRLGHPPRRVAKAARRY